MNKSDVACNGVTLPGTDFSVMGLTALGIQVSMLTSTNNKEDEKYIYKTLEKGEGDLRVLYVTPEKVSKSKRFMSKLEKCHHAGLLSLILIDEAHSTKKVQLDLIEMLKIPKWVKFVNAVNRPNLFHMVQDKSSVGKTVIDDIADFIQADHYHADMDINARERVHMRWSNIKLQVIVRTVAFGMGINKPYVMFVIHHNIGLLMCLDRAPWSSTRISGCKIFMTWSGLVSPKKNVVEVKEIDATGHAKALVSLLQEIQDMDQRATMLQLVEKFKVKNKKVGFELKKDELEQLVIQLILDRVLKEEFSHTTYATNAYVTIGPLAKHVLHGKKNITLEATSGHKSSTSIAKSSKRSR
ncbi:mediator of RNA polymerase II transcription subunit 34 isoform X1 [Tanacetum coccineum]